jgi:hypothetical protein
VRIIAVSAAIALNDRETTVFTVAEIADFTAAAAGLAAALALSLRAAEVPRCGRDDLAAARRLALADAFFTDLRADFVDFLRADAALLPDRPVAFADALLMGR